MDKFLERKGNYARQSILGTPTAHARTVLKDTWKSCRNKNDADELQNSHARAKVRRREEPSGSKKMQKNKGEKKLKKVGYKEVQQHVTAPKNKVGRIVL